MYSKTKKIRLKQQKQRKNTMNHIRTILKEHFLSRNEYCKIMGLDPSHLLRLMKNHHKPTRKTIRLLAKGLERVDKQDWKYHAREITEELEKR
jgi:transcriptional regulator with XRE-family HTH domain